MSDLEPCPFCGAGTFFIQENKNIYSGQPITVEVQHWCEEKEGQPMPRRLVFVGIDRESAIRHWNTRATTKKEVRDE